MKEQVIMELKNIIDTIKLDARQNIKGIKINIHDYGWKYRNQFNDNNLVIDWTFNDTTQAKKGQKNSKGSDF